ncbi:MAG: DUF1257 domain-containing protein [Desulfosudaceae bacterium]
MSMTVRTAIKGVKDINLMMEALEAMGIEARLQSGTQVRGRMVLAKAKIQGRWVGIARNSRSELELVGDSDWKVMKNGNFVNQLRQQTGLAAVKKKVEEMAYSIDTITTEENGSIRVVARAWG